MTPDAYPDARYAAEVVKLYPQVDRQKGTLKVEVHILEPDAQAAARHERARHLSAAEPKPAAAAEPAVLVPAAALRRDAQGDSFVWVVTDGRVRQQRIETAGDVGDKLRVTSGLQGGEAVVCDGEPDARGTARRGGGVATVTRCPLSVVR